MSEYLQELRELARLVVAVAAIGVAYAVALAAIVSAMGWLM